MGHSGQAKAGRSGVESLAIGDSAIVIQLNGLARALDTRGYGLWAFAYPSNWRMIGLNRTPKCKHKAKGAETLGFSGLGTILHPVRASFDNYIGGTGNMAFTNRARSGGVGRTRRAKPETAVQEFHTPSNDEVSEVITDMTDDQAESFAGLVACATVGITDGYTAWVPKWKLQSEGIAVGPLYELIPDGAVKIGNGTFAAAIMLPQRSGGVSRGRKDARVSDIMRGMRLRATGTEG